ncbi:uncharacterized protein LOC142341708 isoform X2 [Convolutriloba macropyga]|uniref:uncharacterized protein LOC142341708 isoform X2 n=1 Tax=Convolutriloba macropyga TaxID=536237 RepID=UPI003F5270C6
METYLLSKDIVKQNYYETALTVCPTIPTCTTHTHVYSVKTSFHSHVIFVTQLNRSAPFAIKKRSFGSSNLLEAIEQSPRLSNQSEEEQRSPESNARRFLGEELRNDPNSTLSGSSVSLEEHHDRSINPERVESDENSVEFTFDSVNNITAHHFPDSFDDEAHLAQLNASAHLAERENRGRNVATLRHQDTNPTVNESPIFSRSSLLRRSFPLCGKRRFVLGDIKAHLDQAKKEGASGVNGNRLGRKSSDEKKRARMNKSNLITPDRVNINNTCIAIWDHVTCDEDELQFRCGDTIEILDQSDKNWWLGKITYSNHHPHTPTSPTEEGGLDPGTGCPTIGGGGHRLHRCGHSHNQGWFPSIFVQDLNERCVSVQVDENMCTIRKFHRRALCVRELLTSERTYVSTLKNIIQIYQDAFKRCKSLKAEEVDTIFCNIGEVFDFHKHLLVALEKCAVDPKRRETRLHEWCVSGAFIGSIGEFVRIYSTYCNHYQAAIAMLKQVQRKKSVDSLIEKCRVRHGEVLSLQHFLLTPIQKICRYQMQLTELVNNTQPQHPDYHNLKFATEEMRRAAFEINERRRSFEAKKQSNTHHHHSSSSGNSQKQSLHEKVSQKLSTSSTSSCNTTSTSSHTTTATATSDCPPSPSKTSSSKESTSSSMLKRIPSKRCSKRLLRFFTQPSL